MRSRVFALTFVFVLIGNVGRAQTFKPTAIIARTIGPVVTVFVSTTGPAPATVTARDKWKLSATQGGTSVLIENAGPTATTPISDVRYNALTEQVEIDVSPAAVGGLNVTRAAWQAVFLGTRIFSVASPELKIGATLKPAKSKDDADLYIMGGFLAGKGTKPIWMLDAKGRIGWPQGRTYHLLGASGTLQINPEPKPPADSSDINPDSLNLYAQMDRLWPHKLAGGLFYGFQGVVKPLGAEFSAAEPTGNLMTSAQVTFFSQPMLKKSVVVDPFIGYEFGKNKQKPDKLFDRPVDLSGYDAIARLVFGTTANYYLFQSEVTPDDVYRVVLSFSWQARALGTDEPFVKSQYVTGENGAVTRQKVLQLKGGSRHFVETGITWNVSPLVAIEAKYKRGSLPPLFQFVNPQITMGVTFKTKFETDLLTALVRP